MKFLANGDLQFGDLERMMFAGGIRRLGQKKKRKKPLFNNNGGVSGGRGLSGGNMARAAVPKAGPSAVAVLRSSAVARGTPRQVSTYARSAVVSNIKQGTTAQQIWDFFEDSCGQVLNVRWVPNNDTMVCVEFADTTGVDWAVKHLEPQQLYINGQAVKVRASEDMRKEQEGRVSSVSQASSGGFSQFPGAPHNALGGALGSADSSSGGPPVETNALKIRISNLPRNTKADAMKSMFQVFGPVQHTEIRTGPDGKCVCDLTFKTVQAASDATTGMHGFHHGGETLSIVQGRDK